MFYILLDAFWNYWGFFYYKLWHIYYIGFSYISNIPVHGKYYKSIYNIKLIYNLSTTQWYPKVIGVKLIIFNKCLSQKFKRQKYPWFFIDEKLIYFVSCKMLNGTETLKCYELINKFNSSHTGNHATLNTPQTSK